MAGGRADSLPALMGSPRNIRNLCIMAHVDHGKTSLADALVASNGLINKRLAGRIRYMDSRKDEIERGITMKSSCVSLTYRRHDQDFLVNLIDSPGHVDFSSEVSTAVRLCDGCIIVVDVVEGVCAQTKVVLKQAWLENIRPVLVLNKIDRLIVETKLTPLECYYHVAQVLEQVNACMGELYNTEVLGKEAVSERQGIRERKVSEQAIQAEVSEAEVSEAQHIFNDWGIEVGDDSDVYFSPEQGNVVFASAYDGWGFSIHHFANQFSKKLGMNKSVLTKTLWGDFYITTKGGVKKIMPGARDKRKNPLFVSFILENLYKVYDTVMVRKDKEEIEKLGDALGVKIPFSVVKSSDDRSKLNFLCSAWLPLASAVLEMVVEQLPSAADISESRAMKLMCSATQRFDSLPPDTQALKQAFVRCSSEEQDPLIVYISKIYGVQRKNLLKKAGSRKPGAREGMGPMSEEEIANRREEIRRRRLAGDQGKAVPGERPLTEEELAALQVEREKLAQDREAAEAERRRLEEEEVFVAFARVYSGTLKGGQKVYVLGPKHDPSLVPNLAGGEHDLQALKHVHECQIGEVYLLLGRELEQVEHAQAGCVVGITGLEEHVIKSATLSSSLATPPFTELTLNVTPILRVALEPYDPRDLPKLRAGMKILNQADPCVQVFLQDSGEYVIVTAGEVHLQRCVDDLQERYAGVRIRTSDPIVPFRETVIKPPTVDKLNEAIEGENVSQKKSDKSDPLGVVEVSGHFGLLRCRAAPLPEAVTRLLEDNVELLRSISKAGAVVAEAKLPQTGQGVEDATIGDSSVKTGEIVRALENRNKLNKETFAAMQELKTNLDNAFKEAGPEWDNAVNQIWSFGPHSSGPNILLNRIKSYPRPSVWEPAATVDSSLAAYDTNFVTGFQLATAAGPLCEEPLMGVAFIVEDWSVHDPTTSHDLAKSAVSSGQVISLSKETLRKAFEQQCQRLMCAMYSCVISVTSEVVGKMYNVIDKRHGRIMHGDITEGSTSWNITAYLPVVESMDFANELRKATSGEAVPQLVFSHWEVLDIDPFWEPHTTEELMHWGEKADSGNVARNYINSVRRRKGLAVEEKIVEFAQKQRTLSKNK